jgi:hypothetical protein
MRSRFLPTPRQTNWLIVIGFASVGFALYLRYLAIEYEPVTAACNAGLDTWLCLTRRTAIMLHAKSIFGWTALALAVIQFVRPTLAIFAAGLIATGLGLVLYNTSLSGVAAALLVLSLARPSPAATPE